VKVDVDIYRRIAWVLRITIRYDTTLWSALWPWTTRSELFHSLNDWKTCNIKWHGSTDRPPTSWLLVSHWSVVSHSVTVQGCVSLASSLRVCLFSQRLSSSFTLFSRQQQCGHPRWYRRDAAVGSVRFLSRIPCILYFQLSSIRWLTASWIIFLHWLLSRFWSCCCLVWSWFSSWLCGLVDVAATKIDTSTKSVVQTK